MRFNEERNEIRLEIEEIIQKQIDNKERKMELLDELDKDLTDENVREQIRKLEKEDKYLHARKVELTSQL
ncbi:hypothetical protein LIT25_07675 [Bacillus sp. F19]|jgi:carbonic anhydrase|nr:hypothetical protein LIT25_07675 [Bacillus sp. F19]